MNVAVTPVQLAKKRNQAKINLWLIVAKIMENFFYSFLFNCFFSKNQKLKNTLTIVLLNKPLK